MKIFVTAAAAAIALGASGASAAFPADVAGLMDATADPCDDFYQYACGGWTKNTTLRASEASHTYSFDTIVDRNKPILQAILEEDWPLVGELYESCMALDKISARGNQPLQVGLARIDEVKTKKQLAKAAGRIASIGPSLFAGVSVYPDPHDAKTNVLHVQAADLLLDDATTYTDPDSFAAIEAPLRTYISTIIELAGINVGASGQQTGSDGSMATDIKWAEDMVINIEKQLAAIKPSEDSAGAYNPVTYADAAASYPLTFQGMAQGLGLLKKSNMTADSMVLLDSPAYLASAEQLFDSLALEDLKLYFSFHYAHYNVRYLGDAFGQASFDFFGKVLQGLEERAPRDEVCSNRALELFPDLLGKYYFLKTFEADREQNVQAMVRAIELAMGEHIARLTWLDEPTRAQAAEKLAKVANLIGHSTAKKSYPFVLKSDNFFANAEAIQTQVFKETIARINAPVDRSLWEISPATVNAYYDPSKNIMVFPTAILQPPFYNGGAHPVQNFGAIGAVIGHELTHGFDTMGSQFDGDGDQRDWWSASAKEAFEARETCMKEQYSAIVEVSGDSDHTPIGNVNGTRTIGENIADNGGVSLAFDAYHTWAQSTTPFDSKGVTDSEVDQLFFVAFGQVWCNKIRDQALELQLQVDPHAPETARVNGVVMNSEPFAQAFQCPVGSKMNPAKKCQLW